MLDATGARVLGEIVEHLHRHGITVLVKGASDEHRRLLTAVGTLAPLVERGHVFATFSEAVAHAAKHVAAGTRRAAAAAERAGAPKRQARPTGHRVHPRLPNCPQPCQRKDEL